MEESALRQVLRLPSTAVVGRGFVITKGSTTSQIDILIRDASKPVVFSDGDLAFITPDVALGIIEVKSLVNPSLVQKTAAAKLAANIELVREHSNPKAFSALFSYGVDGHVSARYLDGLVESSSVHSQRIDFAAIGDALFLKYWHIDPGTTSRFYQALVLPPAACIGCRLLRP